MKLEKLFAPGLTGNSLAFLTGALLTLAFAPFEIYPLAILLPAVLYGLWQNLTPGQAFKRGWLFGAGFFGTGVYWVFISIHTYGNAPSYLAAFFTLGLIAILAIFPGLNGYLLNRFFKSNTNARLFCAFPATWILLEWVRSWFATGFPWLILGYSQINSPLKGYATITGLYSVSLAVLLSSSFLIKAASFLRKKQYPLCYASFFALALLWAIGGYLSTLSWTTAFGPPIKVSLVQGNIPQEIKWSADSTQLSLDTYRNLSESHWDSNIVIWPESAIPLPLHIATDFLDQIDTKAKEHNATFITGIPVQATTEDSYYNAVITLGKGSGFYRKRLLVPFGEYVPFTGVMHKLLDVLNIPMSNFVPGPSRKLERLQADNVKIAAYICYEIAFPEFVLFRDKDINLLLTVSNDAWFGHSIAQAQHLEMAQMRSLELGRPALFVSNNGITAIIDAKGKIQSAAPPYKTYVLTDKVQPTQGQTIWQRIGMDPILFILVVMVFVAIRTQRMTIITKRHD
jgi:apolipoprotein N-acyltransferase